MGKGEKGGRFWKAVHDTMQNGDDNVPTAVGRALVQFRIPRLLRCGEWGKGVLRSCAGTATLLTREEKKKERGKGVGEK